VDAAGGDGPGNYDGAPGTVYEECGPEGGILTVNNKDMSVPVNRKTSVTVSDNKTV
jgi:hypothetical protein